MELELCKKYISGQIRYTRAKIKSRTYSEGETTTDTLITKENDKDFCFNKSYQNIHDKGKIIQIKLL